MPIRRAVMHLIDKRPDGSPAALHMASASLPESGAIKNLVNDVNGGYNAKTGMAWGFFHGESGANPLSGWLARVVSGAVHRLHPHGGWPGAPSSTRTAPL